MLTNLLLILWNLPPKVTKISQVLKQDCMLTMSQYLNQICVINKIKLTFCSTVLLVEFCFANSVLVIHDAYALS